MYYFYLSLTCLQPRVELRRRNAEYDKGKHRRCCLISEFGEGKKEQEEVRKTCQRKKNGSRAFAFRFDFIRFLSVSRSVARLLFLPPSSLSFSQHILTREDRYDCRNYVVLPKPRQDDHDDDVDDLEPAAERFHSFHKLVTAGGVSH